MVDLRYSTLNELQKILKELKENRVLEGNISLSNGEVSFRIEDGSWIAISLDESMMEQYESLTEEKLISYGIRQMEAFLLEIDNLSDEYKSVKENMDQPWKDDILIYAATCTKMRYSNSYNSMAMLYDVCYTGRKNWQGSNIVTDNGRARNILTEHLRAYNENNPWLRYLESKYIVDRIYSKMMQSGFIESDKRTEDKKEQFKQVREHWDEYLDYVIDDAEKLNRNEISIGECLLPRVSLGLAKYYINGLMMPLDENGKLALGDIDRQLYDYRSAENRLIQGVTQGGENLERKERQSARAFREKIRELNEVDNHGNYPNVNRENERKTSIDTRTN